MPGHIIGYQVKETSVLIRNMVIQLPIVQGHLATAVNPWQGRQDDS